MSRIAQEAQEQMERNPLFQIHKTIRSRLKECLFNLRMPVDTYEGPVFLNDIVSAEELAYYVLFEGVVDKFQKEERTSHTYSLRELMKQEMGLSQEGDKDPLDGNDPYQCLYRDFSNYYKIGREFQEIMQENLKLHCPPEWRDIHARQGTEYKISWYNFQQLVDFLYLGIGRQLEFRTLRNAKHKPKQAVIDYYHILIDRAKVYGQQDDLRRRFGGALNLNMLEQRQGMLFLLKTAQYCAEHGISASQLTEMQINLLLGLAGTTRAGDTMVCTCTPILLIERLIPYAMMERADIIFMFRYIRIMCSHILMNELPDMLDQCDYTMKDVDTFFFKPRYFCGISAVYDIFQFYLDCEKVIDSQNNKKIISVLRKLIEELTYDSIPRGTSTSTSKSKKSHKNKI